MTIYSTYTVPPAKRDIEARQATVVPNVVPSYASACSGSARYASACSCWGITATITTAATPVTTTSVVPTVTPYACPNPGICESYSYISCPDGTCACGSDANGGSVCFSIPPDCTSCNADADCSGGRICLDTELGCTGTSCTPTGCCTPLRKVCVKPETTCVNPGSRLLFRGVPKEAVGKRDAGPTWVLPPGFALPTAG